MNKVGSKENSTIIKLISYYLTLWVKAKCQEVEEVKIKLKGSMFNLSRGKLSGAYLSGKNVEFKDLKIKCIQLESSPIKINLLTTLKTRKIDINDGFMVQGLLSLDNKSLEESLLKGPWSWIGCWLSKSLMGEEKPSKIEIADGKLKLVTGNVPYTKSDSFDISASNGKIIFSNIGHNKLEYLPMDPLIEVESLLSKDDYLSITIKAKVNP